VTNGTYDLLETTTDTYGNRANAVQASMYLPRGQSPIRSAVTT
jgi:hypothetical protein